jgi:hypothetical protein
MDRKIHSVTALFDTPDDIIRASQETVKAGYKKFDTNTPYPVHGIERAMNIGTSKLGYVTLFFGLFGAAFGLMFLTFIASFEYPLVIGGKPYFSWPAFIPVTFEITVLSAAISTVATMLFAMFRFPNTSHALHDTDYMKNVSSDQFGLCITAIDPLFDEKKVKDFLEGIGGKNIETIYEPKPEGIRVFEPKFIGGLIIIVLITAGTSYFVLNHLLFWVPFNWMAEQQKVKPQTYSTVFSDGFSMRNPVEGTVARNFIPYEYKGIPDSLIKAQVNPLPFTKEIIEKGRNKFETFCSPCHGYFGQGDSRLKDQFPKPPTLISEKVRKWKDGNLYHVITNGQNVMPSYEKQISRDDRWTIVHYIRVLQRSQNAKDSDLESK